MSTTSGRPYDLLFRAAVRMLDGLTFFLNILTLSHQLAFGNFDNLLNKSIFWLLDYDIA